MASPVLPRFGLGGAPIGNLFRERTDAELADLLETAWELGVRHFDTAPHYGLGLSERRLGRFLAGKPRTDYVLSTKVGRLLRPNPSWDGRAGDDDGFAVPAALSRVWDLSAVGVRTSLAESLERLGLDRVDIAYLHDPERSGDPDAVARGMDALAGVRAEGLVGLIGTGSMDPPSLAATARTGLADVVMVANRYTLADQSVAPEVLMACAEHGTAIVVAALFNGGLLSGAPLAPGAVFDYAPAAEPVLVRVRRIAAICADHGVELPTAALHFPLRDPQVVAIVVGADTGDQLRQNLTRLATPVPPALWADLRARQLIG